MNESRKNLRPLLAWIVVLLALAALRETRVVTMPLGVALILVALAWPLQRRLEQRLPRALSLSLTLLAILAVLAAFVGALLLCVDAIATEASAYEQRFVALLERVMEWLRQRGVRLQFAQANPYQLIERSVRVVSGFAKGIYDFFGSLVLIAVYLFLALVELRGFQRKLLHGAKGPLSRSLVEALSEAGKGIQRFVLARTFVGAGIGGLTALYCRITGLDFALVWGVLAFLLNYIPIFGAVVAVIPPVLLALIQPEAAWLTPTTLVGLTAIHVILGSYVDPWVQGRFLSLSPLVLLFSITFWGWVWGIPGALISVPLTATLVIVSGRFESTKWVAELLITVKEGSQEPQPPVRPTAVPRTGTEPAVPLPPQASADQR
ncbi:MAG: AI-2E family transporter [Verrucomicrobia bacterium]|nr:AI-2E family transporter [Verrucomicrobiota bacterium]